MPQIESFGAKSCTLAAPFESKRSSIGLPCDRARPAEKTDTTDADTETIQKQLEQWLKLGKCRRMSEDVGSTLRFELKLHVEFIESFGDVLSLLGISILARGSLGSWGGHGCGMACSEPIFGTGTPTRDNVLCTFVLPFTFLSHFLHITTKTTSESGFARPVTRPEAS